MNLENKKERVEFSGLKSLESKLHLTNYVLFS